MRALLLLTPLLLAGCSGGNSAFDYDALRGGMSPAEARKLPPDKPLACKVPTSGVGLSVCEVDVTEIVGLKATRLTYVFNNDKLEAASIEFTPGAFEDIAKAMDARYKRFPDPTPGQAAWKVAGGAVISSSKQLRHGNVEAYWLSKEAMRKEAQICGGIPGICD